MGEWLSFLDGPSLSGVVLATMDIGQRRIVLSRPIVVPNGFCCMEERSMNQIAGRKNRQAVVCLFCGLLTPVPDNRLAHDPRLSIIRCHVCGKEAPYPANNITDRQDMPNIGTPRVRVVGMN